MFELGETQLSVFLAGLILYQTQIEFNEIGKISKPGLRYANVVQPAYPGDPMTQHSTAKKNLCFPLITA